jgi:NADP-dependent 3-hydroxy acid dehydrogenase YdfG
VGYPVVGVQQTEAVARAIAFAIEQAASVEVGEIVIRPTAQG